MKQTAYMSNQTHHYHMLYVKSIPTNEPEQMCETVNTVRRSGSEHPSL